MGSIYFLFLLPPVFPLWFPLSKLPGKVGNTRACSAHIFFPLENGATTVSGLGREKGGRTILWSVEVGEYAAHSGEKPTIRPGTGP